MADSDPVHPGQLLLDVIQTIPRSELFTLSAERLFAMATAVVDLGSQRRALLFLRADRLQFFVSCLVYVPRDRYTTAVRCDRRHPGPRVRWDATGIHRACQRITLGTHAFHGPAARRCRAGIGRRFRGQPGPDTGLAERSRADMGRPAHRRRGDRRHRRPTTPITTRPPSPRPTSKSLAPTTPPNTSPSSMS